MLKRLLKSVLLAFMAMLLFSGIALAAWEYLFPITIADTSNTTRAYYPVLLGFGGQTLVDGAKIASSGNNTNMQIGSSNIKYMMATGNVTAVIPLLPSGGVVTASLYTGYTPEQSVFAIITGSGGYVTVADNTTLELGNNFTLEVFGWIDTTAGSNKNLVYKEGAFKTYVSGSGNVTASVLASAGTTTQTLRPVGAGDETNITSVVGAATHWQAVSDASDSSYVYTTSTSYLRDLYTLADGTPGITTINSVTFYFRISTGLDTEWVWAKPHFKIGGVVYSGTEQGYPNYDWSNMNQVFNTSPATGSAWTWDAIAGMQIGISVKGSSGYAGRVADIWLAVNYNVENVAASVAATGISSGGHTVTVSDNTTTLSIQIDALAPVTVAFAGSVPPNANNWTFLQNNVMPYVDNITISVAGTQQLYFAPNTMISGTNIPDRSGNSHNGTITWGSNSGIALSYGEMSSFESYVATSNITGGFSMPTAPMPATWFAAGENVANLPFYDSFSAVAVQTGQPVQILYTLAIISVAFGAFLGIVSFTRSALMAYIAMVVVFAFGSSMTIIPAWIVFVLIIVGMAIMYLYKQVAY